MTRLMIPFLVFFLALHAPTSTAQEAGSNQSGQPAAGNAPSQADQKMTLSRQIAGLVFRANINLKEIREGTVNQAGKSIKETNPEIAKKAEAIARQLIDQEFKVVFDETKEHMAQILSQNFSVQELVYLGRFFSSAIGQKYNNISPQMGAAVMQRFIQRIKQVLADLGPKINQRFKAEGIELK